MRVMIGLVSFVMAVVLASNQASWLVFIVLLLGGLSGYMFAWDEFILQKKNRVLFDSLDRLIEKVKERNN